MNFTELKRLGAQLKRSAENRSPPAPAWSSIIHSNITRLTATRDADEFAALRKQTIENIDEATRRIKPRE